MNLSSPVEIKKLLEKYGFNFQKKFGQNFLINGAIPKKIATASLPEAPCEYACLEIGPGIGVMTVELAALYKKVCAVEIDEKLFPLLDETLSQYDNILLVNSDILKIDIPSLIGENFGNLPCVVCANLPYYITTPVLMYLLESHFPFENITVMVQKEVAQRICAIPGSSEYGAITAAISYYAHTKRMFNVSSGSFMPKPGVDSTVIRLDLYKSPPVDVLSEPMLFKVIKGAFAQRRKTLLNSLSSEFSNLTKEELAEVLNNCSLSGSERGETLGIETFAKISNQIMRTN